LQIVLLFDQLGLPVSKYLHGFGVDSRGEGALVDFPLLFLLDHLHLLHFVVLDLAQQHLIPLQEIAKSLFTVPLLLLALLILVLSVLSLKLLHLVERQPLLIHSRYHLYGRLIDFWDETEGRGLHATLLVHLLAVLVQTPKHVRKLTFYRVTLSHYASLVVQFLLIAGLQLYLLLLELLAVTQQSVLDLAHHLTGNSSAIQVNCRVELI
jgi:hypothetical protein